MSAYYNENNPYLAEWLRELMREGCIADGVVDSRSICDVTVGDLKGFTQCHFFAGIGGWSYALRLAGVSDDVCCWSGSCPCQAFSVAGKKLGYSDERHLFPVWKTLLEQCKPSIVFGEQVASKLALKWIDDVSDQLEKLHYSVGAAVLPAASIGAPHLRERLYWVAIRNMDVEHALHNRLYGGYQGGRIRNGCWSTDRLDVTAQLCTGRILIGGKLTVLRSVKMESYARLNPHHSRWLMGYPAQWSNCAPMVTR